MQAELFSGAQALEDVHEDRPGAAPTGASQAFQRRLGDVLREDLVDAGSPLARLQWRRWHLAGGRTVAALRASDARPQDLGQAAALWPTLIHSDQRNSARHGYEGGAAKPGTTLLDAVRLATWPSVQARAWALRAWRPAPWATPTAQAFACDPDRALARKAEARGRGADCGASVTTLATQVRLVGPEALPGAPGHLAPAFCRWLMGYPDAWHEGAPARSSAPRPALLCEVDRFAREWLARLDLGDLSRGGVEDLAAEASGRTHVHAFAGLGGWSRALDLVGWPPDAPVWTGSCPCQPFSVAGRQRRDRDARHLWPAWGRAIEAHRPPVVLGEQVDSSMGREWFDHVASDLEALGYVVACADLPAAGVGAPHRRQRLYFAAALPTWRAPRLAAGGAPGAEWSHVAWLQCRDRRLRPIRPDLVPLVASHPDRRALIRTYGNALVPQVGAAFVRAVVGAWASN